LGDEHDWFAAERRQGISKTQVPMSCDAAGSSGATRV